MTTYAKTLTFTCEAEDEDAANDYFNHELYPSRAWTSDTPWKVVPAEVDESTDRCPKCGAPMRFVAHYAAPGFGQAWECGAGHPWAKVGDTFFDAADGAHELRPEDVR